MTLFHKYQTHICLVSTQPTPNLVPAIDPDVRPREMVLVVSDAMRKAADHLQLVLERHKVVCEQWPISDPFDIDHVRMRLEKLLQRRAGEELALNVTGGTKVMALAAQDLTQLQQRVEVTAVALEHGSEVAERLVVAPLQYRNEPTRVFFLDLLGLLRRFADAPVFQAAAQFARASQQQDDRAAQHEHQ